MAGLAALAGCNGPEPMALQLHHSYREAQKGGTR
jgi:hypothetical protein